MRLGLPYSLHFGHLHRWGTLPLYSHSLWTVAPAMGQKVTMLITLDVQTHSLPDVPAVVYGGYCVCDIQLL